MHGILVRLEFSLTRAFCSVSKYLRGLCPHFLQIFAQISPYKKKITAYKMATTLLLLCPMPLTINYFSRVFII